MDLSRDFNEFVGYFIAHDVRFLIVGGYAVAAHGHPRYTKDLDVWVRVDRDNGDRILAALDDFGFGDLGLTIDDFLADETVVQLGREPQRIDVLTFITGVDFDEAWERRVLVEVQGLMIPVIGRSDLRQNKLATGRPRDLADAADLAPADDDS